MAEPDEGAERDLLARLIPYVPPYWARRALASPTCPVVGHQERVYCAVLVVDISGFTPIAEALSRSGPTGIEELSGLLERFFTPMTSLVAAYGGEVAKFAGDSLIALFAAVPDRGEAHLGSALRCALHMQRTMRQFAEVETTAGPFTVRIKSGMSEGEVLHTAIGDPEREVQPLLAGLPLARAIAAEQRAEPGETLVDAALLNRLPGSLEIGEARETCRLIAGACDVPTLPATRALDLAALAPRRVWSALRVLTPFLPAQLVERLRQEEGGLTGEHRRVTVAFCRFGGLVWGDRAVGAGTLHVYLDAMRSCAKRHGGRLNEIDATEDGGRFVVLFGAPAAHQDNELRAAACAWEMHEIAGRLAATAGRGERGLRQRTGVSSGQVYAGAVGAPDRRTYTVVGDAVNLASRLSDRAAWGEVLIAERVAQCVGDRYQLESVGRPKIRGKSDLVTVYALGGPRDDGGSGIGSGASCPVPDDRRPREELTVEGSLRAAREALAEVSLSLGLASQIVAEVGGDPFCIHETVQALAQEVAASGLEAAEVLARGAQIPSSVADAVLAQIDPLDEGAKSVARLAAVLPDPFPVSVLCAAELLSTPCGELDRHLDALVDAHVLARDERAEEVRYRFRHRTVRRVIYANTLLADRERFHRGVLKGLERTCADDLAPHYDTLIDHALDGRVPHKVGLYEMLAADLAAQQGRGDEAAARYRRAEVLLAGSETCPRRCRDGLLLRLLLQRSRAYLASLDAQRALIDAQRAEGLACRLGDARSLGAALALQAEVAIAQARYLDAFALAQRGSQVCLLLGDRDACDWLALAQAEVQRLQGAYARALDAVSQVVGRQDERPSDETMSRCRLIQGAVAATKGTYREAEDALLRAERLGRRAGAAELAVAAQLRRAEVLLHSGQWGEGLALARAGLQASEELRAPLAAAWAERTVALFLDRIGAHAEAARHAERAMQLLADSQWWGLRASVLWVAGQTSLSNGDPVEARKRLDQSLSIGRTSGAVEVVVMAQLGLGQVAEASADLPTGYQLYAEARARARHAGLDRAVVAARLGLGRVYLARGSSRRAQYEAMQALDASYRLGCPYEALQATTLLAASLDGLSQPGRAERYREEARSLVAQLADALPGSLAGQFLDRPQIQAVCQRAARPCASEGT
ncbi:MAG: hypothetical protein JXA09_11375 [Anaerolineae bacterium]|nr:hypothetical protein [Anaerolineae bacterium]